MLATIVSFVACFNYLQNALLTCSTIRSLQFRCLFLRFVLCCKFVPVRFLSIPKRISKPEAWYPQDISRPKSRLRRVELTMTTSLDQQAPLVNRRNCSYQPWQSESTIALLLQKNRKHQSEQEVKLSKRGQMQQTWNRKYYFEEEQLEY